MDKGKAETRTDAAESAQESSSAQFDTLPLMYLPLPPCWREETPLPTTPTRRSADDAEHKLL